MDALVTGGTGFVGANLVRELLTDGHPVRVLARHGGDRRALDGDGVQAVAEGALLGSPGATERHIGKEQRGVGASDQSHGAKD